MNSLEAVASPDSAFVRDMLLELDNVRERFPANISLDHLLAEAHGAIALELRLSRRGASCRADLRRACTHLAALALRLAVEGEIGLPATIPPYQPRAMGAEERFRAHRTGERA
ncbi:MAG: hypothetical protein KF895_16600 [Parvibaculum sp.]|uniref:hypothetical protein n=1 Tax=Chelatococcus sp. TaxID=1953771 RepID=UPI001EC8CEE0|nr:hypothetical protein [Chelatococcus sp.]MBX3507100.1 hypothetical protein [Parvibaculum sp.]MBX3545561.1 hypothetical protein [Chelatococcus sp.]